MKSQKDKSLQRGVAGWLSPLLEHVCCIFKIISEQSIMSNNDEEEQFAFDRLLNSDEVQTLSNLLPNRKIPGGSVKFPPRVWYVALDGSQETRKKNYDLFFTMAKEDLYTYMQLMNQLPTMTDASKNKQVFEWMLRSCFPLVHYSVILQENVSTLRHEIQFHGVTYLDHPKFKEIVEKVLDHMHEFYMDFVEKLDPLQICEHFKYVDNMLGYLEIEWSTRLIFPSVKQFAEMARKVHSLYQVDKNTTNLPLSLAQFSDFIAEMCWKLAWSIEELQRKDILEFLREFAGPVAEKLLEFHMNHKFYSVSDEEKKNMLMKRNDPPGYITVNGEQIQMSLEAWLKVIYTDFICKNKDPEFNIFQFLVGYYAHDEAERIELLGWINTLVTTATGNDLHYNIGTNHIIKYLLEMIFDTAKNDGILCLESDGGVVQSEPKSEERDSKRAKSDQVV